MERKMINLFNKLNPLENQARISKDNAQEYTSKVLEAVSLLKSVHEKNAAGFEVKKLCSTDVVIETAPLDVNGDKIVFKMGFSYKCAEPHSVEIIELKG